MLLRVAKSAGFLLLFILGVLTQNVSATETSTFKFMRGVYSAFDSLEANSKKGFGEAASYLQLAADYADNHEARNIALDAAVEFGSMTSAPRVSATQVETLKNKLKKALELEQLKLNQQHPEETEILKRLIKAHLFPETWPYVKMSFEGITDTQGVALMGLYLTDPRSAKYDPSIRKLLGENDPDPEKRLIPRVMRIVFTTPEQVYEIPEDMTKEQVQKKAREIARSLIDPASPLRYTVRVKESNVFVSLQVFGAKNSTFIEHTLRDGFALAHGNRYVYAAANKFDEFASYLKRVSQNENTKKLAKKASGIISAGLEKLSQTVRDRVTVGLRDPNPSSVKKKVEKIFSNQNKKILNDASKTVEKMKLKGATAAEMKAVRDKAANLVAQNKNRLASIITKIDDAVAAFKASPEYTKTLGSHMRALKTLYVAEGVASKNVNKFVRAFTWDRALKGISLALASYTIYRGIQLYTTTNDPNERLMIWRNYGIKLINVMVYAAPVAGEAALLIDLGGILVEKALGNSVDIPSVEDALQGLATFTQYVAYWSEGQNNASMHISELVNEKYGIPNMYIRDGFYTDPQLNIFVKEVISKTPSKQTKENQQQRMVAHVRSITQKYVSVILVLEDTFGKRRNPDIHKFIGKAYEELAGEKGYLVASSHFLRKAMK